MLRYAAYFATGLLMAALFTYYMYTIFVLPRLQY
ncbi:hypothetical protein HMPREF9695_00585 [Afipia broomeae ATCC 49717]|uniref:Uncharacterized protein n=1 Tax=Afipia broomeae ATCC 49717 TaxID=883078 RepID=K8PSZ2_9BRAD|nr:hypothetical protein HMPREF9695_00585 [Afipia broomeae ATCC 49717]